MLFLFNRYDNVETKEVLVYNVFGITKKVNQNLEGVSNLWYILNNEDIV